AREVVVQLRQERLQLRVERLRALGEPLASLLEQVLDLAPAVAQLEAPADGLDALLDQLEMLGVELLGLDEYLFPHADLAEIVEQRGVADLLHLVRREVHLSVRPRGHAINGLREADRQVRDAEGMAGGGRV